MVLEEGRARGMLGPGPVEPHIDHALGLGRTMERWDVVRGLHALDLGSGGGLPGLVVASSLPASTWVLLDAQERRTDFLAWAVEELSLADRVTVVRDRAERAGRDVALRARFSVVCARSFGAPAVTAECGAPFLVEGGLLMVSEPPEPDPLRWPTEGLAQLGLECEEQDSWAVLRRSGPLDDRFPRRDGLPEKRPLW